MSEIVTPEALIAWWRQRCCTLGYGPDDAYVVESSQCVSELRAALAASWRAGRDAAKAVCLASMDATSGVESGLCAAEIAALEPPEEK